MDGTWFCVFAAPLLNRLLLPLTTVVVDFLFQGIRTIQFMGHLGYTESRKLYAIRFVMFAAVGRLGGALYGNFNRKLARAVFWAFFW